MIKRNKISFILVVLLLLVAVTPAYASADPLDEWQLKYDPQDRDGWRNITYGNGIYVVDESYYPSVRRLNTSTDGTNWTSVDLGGKSEFQMSPF